MNRKTKIRAKALMKARGRSHKKAARAAQPKTPRATMRSASQPKEPVAIDRQPARRRGNMPDINVRFISQEEYKLVKRAAEQLKVSYSRFIAEAAVASAKLSLNLPAAQPIAAAS